MLRNAGKWRAEKSLDVGPLHPLIGLEICLRQQPGSRQRRVLLAVRQVQRRDLHLRILFQRRLHRIVQRQLQRGRRLPAQHHRTRQNQHRQQLQMGRATLPRFLADCLCQRAARNQVCSRRCHPLQQALALRIHKGNLRQIHHGAPAFQCRTGRDPALFQFLHPGARQFPFQLESGSLRRVVNRNPQHDAL